MPELPINATYGTINWFSMWSESRDYNFYDKRRFSHAFSQQAPFKIITPTLLSGLLSGVGPDEVPTGQRSRRLRAINFSKGP